MLPQKKLDLLNMLLRHSETTITVHNLHSLPNEENIRAKL